MMQTADTGYQEPAGSNPLVWVKRLEDRLNGCQKDLELYDRYYEGEHRLAFATDKFRSAFGTLFSAFADNWCDLVVDAVEERLNVEGFKLPGGDKAGDNKAWRYWQSNRMDADSQLAHTEALIGGRSAAIVWVDGSGFPSITVESAQQVAVAMVAGSRRQRAAALKRWVDDDGYEQATLYLPTEIYKYRSRQKLQSSGQRMSTSVMRWVPREVASEQWPLPNPLGVVPVVPLENRPRLLRAGVSEIKRVVPLQDAVNKTVADMMVASEFGAAPQRWATGLEVPTDPVTGQALAVFNTMVDRMLTSGDPNSRFGQFTQTDLTVFVKAVEMLVQHIASQTRTPPHYFALTGQFPSGDAIKSAETGLVAKVQRKMVHFGEAWEEVMALAFAVDGDMKRAVAAQSSEIRWRDPESRSEAQHIDAVTKLKVLNVPDEILWRRAGFSPTEIDEMKKMIAAEPPADVPQVPPTLTETVRA
jgi:hypothetical protein